MATEEISFNSRSAGKIHILPPGRYTISSTRFNSRSAGKIHCGYEGEYAEPSVVSIPAVRVRYIK